MKRIKKRVLADDADAMLSLGWIYYRGEMGLLQDTEKTIKLWLQAGELGCAEAYNNIGVVYEDGEGVEKDVKMSKHFYELAAMGGCLDARNHLGFVEEFACNMNKAVKHWMISAGAGHDESLMKIRECFVEGHATKGDFERALRAHQASKDEIKSDQRDAAAAGRKKFHSLGA